MKKLVLILTMVASFTALAGGGVKGSASAHGKNVVGKRAARILDLQKEQLYPFEKVSFTFEQPCYVMDDEIEFIHFYNQETNQVFVGAVYPKESIKREIFCIRFQERTQKIRVFLPNADTEVVVLGQ